MTTDTQAEIQEITIRTMTTDDLDDIFELDRLISSSGRVLTYQDMVDNSYLGGEISSSFIAETHGKVVGFVMVANNYELQTILKTCVIYGLGVHPDYRHRGIAQQLVKRLMDSCASNGIRNIRTTIDRQDKQLLSFFNELHFQPGNRVEYAITLP